MIFFTAPRNFTLVRASGQILDVPRLLLLVLLAVRMNFWTRHIAARIYIRIQHRRARARYVDRYVISIGAYTFALAFAPPLTPMTRICMHMSSTGTETDGKSAFTSRSAPFVVPRATPPPSPRIPSANVSFTENVIGAATRLIAPSGD